MSRYIGFLLGLLLFCQTAAAQNSIFLHGEVRDSTGVPLQFANVMAVDTSTQKMAGFAVTNPEGQFRIGLKSGSVYTLRITFIGYAPFERIIQPMESNKEPIVFLMTNSGIRLDELQIIAEMPVTIRGDTITYETEAFTQGDERKLEDVLEDLPGFRIEENGEIKVQGKTVNKVLIDGKEFFDGDSKLATKNLPANVVDKVQLLQNFNDISPLRGLGPSDQLALNVQLKPDKKEIVFGDLTAAAGPQKRYLGHANTFYYSQNVNLNLIADANNIGELAFTMNDYFRFAGGLGSLTARQGSNFNVSNDQTGIPMAERNTARALDNELGAFNYSITPTRGLELSGFLIGSSVDNDFGSLSNRTYLQETQSFSESLLASNRIKSHSGLGKFSVRYAPNYDVHISYEIFGRNAHINNRSYLLSEVADSTNNINSKQTQQPWGIEQQFRAFYAPNDLNVLSLEVGQDVQYRDPRFTLKTSLRPFRNTLPLSVTEGYNLLQNRMIQTDKIEGIANYYRILNRTNHLNISAGYAQNKQDYDASIFQIIDEDRNDLGTDQFRNAASLEFMDIFAGILFKSKWGKLTWSPELNLHSYQLANQQLSESTGFDRMYLLPGFNAKFDIRSSQSINFTYNRTATFMDIEKLISNIYITSYNYLETGNPELVNSLAHNFDLNYRNFNMYSFFNIYGGVNMVLKKSDIQNSFTVSAWERIGRPLNVLPINRELRVYLNTEKRFDHFRVSVDGSWTFSEINNQLNEAANVNLNFRQGYNGRISTRLWKKLRIRLTHDVLINRYEGSQNSSRFINHESGIRTNFKVFTGFRWITEYSYTRYNSLSSNTRATYDMLDMYVRYRKKGSPWEFSVEGLNMLNTKNIRRDSFTENLISTYAYDIQQRYFIFKVMFDI